MMTSTIAHCAFCFWLLCLLQAPMATSANLRSSEHSNVSFTNWALQVAVKEWLQNSSVTMNEYGHISEWNVSRVTDMSSLFANASDFHDDLSSWDVGEVMNMSYTFFGATSFDSDVSSWNVTNVRDMSHMFHGASRFNSDLSTWDTTQTLDFSYMFADATSFNGNVSSWDITSSYDLSYMFCNATSFNGDVSSWTLETTVLTGFQIKWVQDMQSMFQGASSFNGELSMWDTYATYNMNSMFKDASIFSGNLTHWDVQLVEDFGEMFSGSAFDGHLCWNVRDGANTSFMFDATTGSLEEDCEVKETEVLEQVGPSSSARPRSILLVYSLLVLTILAGALDSVL